MGSIALLRPLLGGRVARLFLAVCAGVGLATSLGLAYPVQRELDAASYSRAAFGAETQFIVPASTAPLLAEALPGPNCLAVRWITTVGSGGRSAGPVDLLGLSPECDQTQTTFPDSTRYAERPVVGERWVDLTGDAARELGVGPGDAVTVYTGDDRQPLYLTVRGLYAARPAGPFGGRAAAGILLAAQQEEGAYSTLFTAAGPAEIAATLARPEVQPLLDPKAPPIVSGRDVLDAAAADRSAASLGLVRVIAVLALLGGLAFALRETDVFRRHLLEVLRPVHELGGAASAMLRSWAVVAVGTTVAAALAGVAIGTLPYWLGALAPTFPRALLGVLGVATAGALTVFALVMSALYTRSGAEFGRSR